MSIPVGLLGVYLVAAFCLGVVASTRIPDGIEATAWRRLARRVRRLRRGAGSWSWC